MTGLTLGAIMGPSVLIAAGVCLGVGLVLLIRGLRGRRADDHPICGKCRFDLHGVYPRGKICPECGSRLAAVGAVTYGTWRRRPGLIKAGAAAIIPAVLVLLAAASLAVMKPNLARHKPTWFLRSELGARSVLTAQEAAQELQRRMESNGIAKEHISAIVNAALDRQANGGLRWDKSIGDLIEYTIDSGLAKTEQHHRYLENAIRQWRIDAPSSLHSGDVLRYNAFSVTDWGAGFDMVRLGHSGVAHFSFHLVGATLDGNRLILLENEIAQTNSSPTAVIRTYPPTQSGPTVGRAPAPPRLSLPAIVGEEGRHEVVLTYEIMAFESPQDMEPFYTWRKGFAVPVEIRSPDRELVDLVQPGRSITAKKMHESMQFDDMSGWWSDRPNDPNGELRVSWDVDYDDMPVDVAFDIYLVQGDNEWFLDTLRLHQRATGSHGRSAGVTFEDGPTFETGLCTLILRPSPDVATQEWPFMNEIWGEEIVYKNVPIEIPEK